MKHIIHYKDLEKSESIESMILERVNTMREKFLSHDEAAKVEFFLSEDRHRTEIRRPQFHVEIVLKTSHPSRLHKVERSEDDFKLALNKATEAMNHILRKEHDKI